MIQVIGRAMNQITGATRGFHRDSKHGVHDFCEFYNCAILTRIQPAGWDECNESSR
jgi:hypothetical protein